VSMDEHAANAAAADFAEHLRQQYGWPLWSALLGDVFKAAVAAGVLNSEDSFAPEADDEALLALMAEPQPDLSPLTDKERQRCGELMHLDALRAFEAGIRRLTKTEFIAMLKVRNPEVRAMPDDELFELVLVGQPECRDWVDGGW
jgi:hypothetical protein